MNKSTLKSLFAAALCAALATSCGSSSSKEGTSELSDATSSDSSSSKERTVELSGGVALDIAKTPEGLWFGKTEVTQAQWESVMGHNPSKYKNPNNPVEKVSWDDCQTFLGELNALPTVKESGLTFRLPTEEEWESACRAGATGDYCRLSDGTEITEDTLDQVAWFHDNSDRKTHPVGQKQPNDFGLYDMLGNVEELTSTAVGDTQISRGGCGLDYCEVSKRSWCSPSRRWEFLGFRLCAETAAK